MPFLPSNQQRQSKSLQMPALKLGGQRINKARGTAGPGVQTPSNDQGDLKIFTNSTRHFCGTGYMPTVAVSSYSCAEESTVIFFGPQRQEFLKKHTHTRAEISEPCFASAAETNQHQLGSFALH